MVNKVKPMIEKLFNSEEYKKFHENYPDYYLAHCFVQLNKEGNEDKQWQFGFYSPEKDNLTTFVLEPAIKQGEFEEAFKEGGIIERLHTNDLLESDHAMDVVHELVSKEYAGELVNNYILIIQTSEQKIIYNITAITASFSMLTIKIDGTTGEIINHQKRSILDLKKED